MIDFICKTRKFRDAAKSIFRDSITLANRNRNKINSIGENWINRLSFGFAEVEYMLNKGAYLPRCIHKNFHV